LTLCNRNHFDIYGSVSWLPNTIRKDKLYPVSFSPLFVTKYSLIKVSLHFRLCAQHFRKSSERLGDILSIESDSTLSFNPLLGTRKRGNYQTLERPRGRIFSRALVHGRAHCYITISSLIHFENVAAGFTITKSYKAFPLSHARVPQFWSCPKCMVTISRRSIRTLYGHCSPRGVLSYVVTRAQK